MKDIASRVDSELIGFRRVIFARLVGSFLVIDLPRCWYVLVRGNRDWRREGRIWCGLREVNSRESRDRSQGQERIHRGYIRELEFETTSNENSEEGRTKWFELTDVVVISLATCRY